MSIFKQLKRSMDNFINARVPISFWEAWKEKFYSLFVSMKIIMFFTILILSTFLLYHGIIDMAVWSTINVTNVTATTTARGAVEIAQIFKGTSNKSVLNKIKDEEE